jgi:DNA-binding MurR/RpiR family transcriptional regulator
LVLVNVSVIVGTVTYVSVTLTDVIADAADRLSPAERRVADAVVADPARVAFGTVASVAVDAGVSGPTVVRLAAKLGYDGFVALQEDVQRELAHQLRPAAERIRAERATDLLGRTLQAEIANVAATLERADRRSFARAAGLLADPRRAVHVLAGEATAGVASVIAANLDLLRDRVSTIGGSPVAVGRAIAGIARGDVVLVIEVRRYERWVLDAVAAARDAGAAVIALTDSVVAPVADGARATFVVDAVGSPPFDSHVATLALGNALVAEVAARLRASAAARLDGIEAATASLLVD